MTQIASNNTPKPLKRSTQRHSTLRGYTAKGKSPLFPVRNTHQETVFCSSELGHGPLGKVVCGIYPWKDVVSVQQPTSRAGNRFRSFSVCECVPTQQQRAPFGLLKSIFYSIPQPHLPANYDNSRDRSSAIVHAAHWRAQRATALSGLHRH